MEFVINETEGILVSHSHSGLAGAVLEGSPLRRRLNGISLGKRKRPGNQHCQDGTPEFLERAIELARLVTDGQRLLLPDIEISTWWTSLKLSPKQVVELYHQHGISEQFHSGLTSDMDLERQPSGKFATDALMLSLGMVAYNLL